MESKIKEYFSRKRLGKIQYIREVGKWANGKLFHVKTNKILGANEYTVYELNNDIKTVRSLQTNKMY